MALAMYLPHGEDANAALSSVVVHQGGNRKVHSLSVLFIFATSCISYRFPRKKNLHTTLCDSLTFDILARP